MLPLIVTRPAEVPESDRREHELRQAGIRLRRFPLIRILPPDDVVPAQLALSLLDRFDCAIPVSPVAVWATFQMLTTPWPASCMVGLVGPGSRAAFEQAVRARGQAPESLCIVSAPAETAESEGLWAALRRFRTQGWAGARVLILRGGPGREWLSETLSAAGAQVQCVSVYRREAPTPDATTLAELRRLIASPAAWLLTASEAVSNLGSLLRAAGMNVPKSLAMHVALATHRRIADAANEAGFGRVQLCAPEPSAMIRALARE